MIKRTKKSTPGALPYTLPGVSVRYLTAGVEEVTMRRLGQLATTDCTHTYTGQVSITAYTTVAR